MLSVSNLHAGYGRTAVLSGVDLYVGLGEIVAILGRNGVGKTTLLRTIMGLLPARQGRIMLDGHGDLTPLPAHARARAGLAYVPQGRQIFPRLSVRDNLRVAALAAGRDPQAGIAATVAEFPALEPKLPARGASLSGGQQQLLALARALATQPRLLLLDEATQGIQPSIVEVIRQKVQDINRNRGVAVLLVEQNIEFAVALASRTYIMNKGQIVLELAPQDVLRDQTVQREYLGV
jgi:urea ABC transporter ATP-binding protein UrtE